MRGPRYPRPLTGQVAPSEGYQVPPKDHKGRAPTLYALKRWMALEAFRSIHGLLRSPAKCFGLMATPVHLVLRG